MSSAAAAREIADRAARETTIRLDQWRTHLATRDLACDTCLDVAWVIRIRGGASYAEPCPDCAGGEW